MSKQLEDGVSRLLDEARQFEGIWRLGLVMPKSRIGFESCV